jgi:hypothetical protein
MTDDPAIQEARCLWQQRKSKEAMVVLVDRIRELNRLLEAE